MKKTLSFLCGLLLLVACTKKNGLDSSGLLSSSSDPDRVVFDVLITIGEKDRKKLKRTDLMIWDLKDRTGLVVVGAVEPAPKEYPFRMTIKAKALLTAVDPKEEFVYSVRIVRYGEESKPPKKGQLQAIIGMTGESKVDGIWSGKLTKKEQTLVSKALVGRTPDKIVLGAKKQITLEPILL